MNEGCSLAFLIFEVQLNPPLKMAKLKNYAMLKDLSGAFASQLIFKQYSYGTVVSKVPDMSGIKRTRSQKRKNNRFKEAVKYARAIVNDPQKKKAFAKKLKVDQRVYTAAIKEYLKLNP